MTSLALILAMFAVGTSLYSVYWANQAGKAYKELERIYRENMEKRR